MTKKEKEERQGEKQVKLSTAIWSVLVILVGYLAVIGVMIYVFRVDNVITQKTARIFPYPAAIVGDHVITVSNLKDRLGAARRFYENQDFSDAGVRIDFGTSDGKKRLALKEKNILNKMVEDEVIEAEANKRGIKISNEDISREVTAMIDQYGSGDGLKDNMEKLYGWTIEDFEKNIVRPELYQQKLYEDFRNKEADFQTAKDKIDQAKKDLDDKKDFESVVAKYSEGDSVKNRGDLGWFTANQMLTEISSVAFDMDKNNISDVIESSLGYHIIQVMDKKTDGGEAKVHIRQIFVRTPSFPDWLAEREKETRIYIPIRDFMWNKNGKSVEFENNDMKQFEEKVKNDPNGDISVLF